MFDGQQIRNRGVTLKAYVGERGGFAVQRAGNFAARRISVRVQNAVAAVRSFAGEGELLALAVELGAPLDQVLNRGGTLLHQRVNGALIAESIARIERVLLMERDFIVIAQSYGDTALSVLRRRLAQRIFGDNQNVS